MPLIDKAISWISPKWSAERSAWRTIEASYKGGVPTRTSESWSRSNGFRFESGGDRQILANARDRALQAYKNNPVARTLVDTETDNVIGDGLNYQPSSSSEDWNREAKDRYYQWLQSASVRGSDIHTGCELERLLWSRSRVAGDIGWILVNRDYVDRDTGALVINSKIQVVQSENIVTPDGKYSDQSVYDGIKFDSTGQPTEFYVLATDEYGKRDFITIGARDFVYLPHMPDVSLARGQTCYLTIFDLLAHLDRYVDGVSLAAWMGTVFGIVFKQNNAAKQLTQLQTLTNSQGNPQRAVTFENGMVKYVGTDEEVAQVQAQQPMQQTPEFIRAMYRMLGQPFDMPLEVIAKDMSVCTFASARIGLLPFYRSCRIKAARFGSRWSRTIRWWLSRERLRGPNDPNKWDNAFPADYWNHDLLVNAWDYTDPVSEAQSDLLQIDMGTKSRKMVVNERGRDFEQINRENDEAKAEAGEDVIHSTMTRDPMPKPVAPAAAPAQASDSPINKLLTNFVAAHGDSVKAYARAYKDLLGSMKDDAPVINVNVPEQKPSIVNIAPPDVTVNMPAITIPEQPASIVNVAAPEVTVNAPDVTVNVPAQPAADVTVNVPEQPAPIVNVAAPEVTVNVPKAGPITRTIERDGDGFIKKIREE